MRYLKTFKNIQKVNESETPTDEKERLKHQMYLYGKVSKMLDADYEDFIKALIGRKSIPTTDTLAKIDPKIKAILNMGLRDSDVKDEIVGYTTPNLEVKELEPTQSQIGLADSIGFVAFKNPNAVGNYLSDAASFGGGAILTCDNKYILDGHHRWSGVFMINPDATVPCVNINLGVKDGKEALKVMQLAIAASYGKPNEPGSLWMKVASANTDLFNNDITGPNGEKIPDLLKRIFAGEKGIAKIPDGGSLENVPKFIDNLKTAWETDEKGVIEKLVKNAVVVKGYMPDEAPPRSIMPQPSDTADKLGEPTEDGPGKMPAAVINKLASGELNFRNPVMPVDKGTGSSGKLDKLKVVDNFNTFINRE